MPTALVITHTESEDPGHLAAWLPEVGVDLHVVQPWAGDALPTDLEGHVALVSMGGPQQAWDEASAPWLAETKALIRQAVEKGMPFFGVCLGGQLLAEAVGGKVLPGAAGPELGLGLVAKRDAAGEDPLFWDLPLSPVVVQWHWDAVTELPPDSVLLMSNPRYPHQAFRVGPAAWGIQFHVETPEDMVRRWAIADRDAIPAALGSEQELLARTLPELPEVAEVWGEVLRRFGRLALERAA